MTNITFSNNRIPGTDYEIHGDKNGGAVFIGKDGKEISQDQFLAKVESKEISLTSNSLTFLKSWVGPDTMDSLRSSSGYQSTPSDLLSKMGVSDTMMGDLYSLMEILAKTAQDQKKMMTDVKHGEQDLQIKTMEKGAEDDMKAAEARAIFGFISAGLTITSGVTGAIGSGIALGHSQGELVSKLTDGITTGISGGAKAMDTTGGLVSSTHEQDSKEKDIQSKKLEQMQNETRDTIDTIREMHAKVKELLQSIQQAEDESSKSVARM